MELSKIRIISGKWRGRKIEFPSDVVRPTGDRIRETLFNWLQSDIYDATCLDLFAGSGAFSFESLSRGAKKVVAVDQSTEVINCLKNSAKRLLAENLKIINASTPSENLARQLSEINFDIIFIDPPFEKGLLKETVEWVIENISLNKNALIYVEAEKDLKIDFMPENFELLKDKTAGKVRYLLYIVKSA